MSQSDSSSEAQRTRSNRLQLIVMLVIASASLGGSYLLFFQARDGNLWGTTNQGQWVEPAIKAADLTLVDAQGAAIVPEPLWGLWVVAAQGCDQLCGKAVHEMRQLHILLSKDADRVRRALIAPGAGTASLAEPYPKLGRWRQVGGVVAGSWHLYC